MTQGRESIELIAPEGTEQRLDLFLARTLHLTRTKVKDLIVRAEVRVNGRRARKGLIVREGDQVRVDLRANPFDEAPFPEPDLPVEVLYIDDSLIAVNKPAGMPTHVLHSTDRGTVANFLVSVCPEVTGAGADPREGGVVHRLDTGTSGALLAARHAAAYRDLRNQFHERRVRKVYLAIVSGDVCDPGVLSSPVAHVRGRPDRMRACPDLRDARASKARDAVTEFRPLRRFGKATLLEVTIRTGTRHQVRVHLAAHGHPLLGDTLYGRPGSATETASRPLLHARLLEFEHPSSRRRRVIIAPLPSDFELALQSF